MPSPADPSSSSHDVAPVGAGPNATVAGVASLFVIVHFCCVFAVMSANYSPSPIQSRLVRLFAPYTQTLNLDLNFTPYHLTHATDQDVDHSIEFATQIDPPADGWRPIQRGWRGGERYKRYQRLGAVLSYFRQDAATSSRIGKAVASGLAHEEDAVKVIRCRKHFLLPWDRYGRTGVDPDDEQYFQTVYSANVIRSERGVVDVVKVEASAEVARPQVQAEKETP